MSLTKQYPFESMSVGDSFTVIARFQHARVAASEYGRKHGCVFTCRMQEDRTMIVYRVEANQASVDVRGRRGRRRIVANADPTALQFDAWLQGFSVGQSYTMPSSYVHLYAAMQAWCELHSIKRGRTVTATVQAGTLVIHRAI